MKPYEVALKFGSSLRCAGSSAAVPVKQYLSVPRVSSSVLLLSEAGLDPEAVGIKRQVREHHGQCSAKRN